MAWSAARAIRERREALGLSQADLAERLRVTKTVLSLYEGGKRLPTEDHVASLAATLGVPAELLQVGSGKLPSDVQQAFDFDAAGVVAAIRQRIEARALSYPTTPVLTPLPAASAAPALGERLPERIDVQKTTTSYRAHSYHTKVPPEAIQPFINAFTRPGETVSDPFCGSGMTGVAALMEGRNALLSDVSPAAVHIARNYTTPCDPSQFASTLATVSQSVAPTINWLYRPIGSDRLVEYTTWSDIYRCRLCDRQITYWEAVQQSATDGDRVTCPACSQRQRKSELQWVGEVPVQSHTSAGSSRIDSHDPIREELALIESSNAAPIPYWIPQVEFGPEREMWRASHRVMGIDNVAGFFTKRNLHALAALRHAIVVSSDGRVREALLFAFTAAVNRASKRYQWNAKRPTNVMTGTLYVSSLRYEWNVWSLFKRKAADVLRYYKSFPDGRGASAQVFQRSATELGCIPDGTVDLVFMDPPFGSNIFYADSSLLWDAWLGAMTDQQAEIVVNRQRSAAQGGKDLKSYGHLLAASFSEASRVLKRGGRGVLAFSNSDDQVWRSVQEALAIAGLDTDTVHVLNKGQPSIKGVKGVTGKEEVTTFDLLLCLKHRPARVAVNATPPAPGSLITQAIRAALGTSELGCRTDEVYSQVIRAILEARYSVTGITMPWIAQQCRELGASEREGRWRILEVEPMADPRDFVKQYLAPSDELPSSTNKSSVDKALSQQRVIGGRNSALYSAHSYHTKVPPEAIGPFIEHYTKPGDIVLDLFCGSGMTGVAAAQAGRRCILNDLSPAAIHLAWNHTRPCDPDALHQGFKQLEARVRSHFEDRYGTRHIDGSKARIHWTLWSARYQCPECRKKFLLWDVVDRKSGRLGKDIVCSGCLKSVRRSALKRLGSEPAWIAYETETGKRFEKAPDASDIKKANKVRREAITAWYPTTPLGPDREMYLRCALHLQGISTIADFYTNRNLEALAILWQEIRSVEDERVRGALAFAFTNTAWHGTKMRRFNARGGQRPLTGTLYIPQLSSEANVLEVLRNKIGQLERYFRSYECRSEDLPAVTLGSATHLAGVMDASVDYVFTDPPFGSNIFYADCNLVWESWLGRFTDVNHEAVVNRSLSPEAGGKSLDTYSSLMSGAMREMYRVLKPGGWATVVFHNTDAGVWQSIHDAALGAGFSFHEAASLDRQQQSHKGYKGRSGAEDVAHFDVIFNLRKPQQRHTRVSRGDKKEKPIDVAALVAAIAQDAEIASRGLQGVHAEVMRRLASQGTTAYVAFADVRALWERVTS
jgi:DNA modification methylase/transcriptional regulator with XRE-family HTH domain/DNA-directed RNA polymerase subunit RPC12/RpoP